MSVSTGSLHKVLLQFCTAPRSVNRLCIVRSTGHALTSMSHRSVQIYFLYVLYLSALALHHTFIILFISFILEWMEAGECLRAPIRPVCISHSWWSSYYIKGGSITPLLQSSRSSLVWERCACVCWAQLGGVLTPGQLFIWDINRLFNLVISLSVKVHVIFVTKDCGEKMFSLLSFRQNSFSKQLHDADLLKLNESKLGQFKYENLEFILCLL